MNEGDDVRIMDMIRGFTLGAMPIPKCQNC